MKKRWLVLISLFTWHAVPVVFDIDTWPLTNYPMYSQAKEISRIKTHHLDGIGEDGKVVRIGRGTSRPPFGFIYSGMKNNDYDLIHRTMKDFSYYYMNNTHNPILLKKVELIETSVSKNDSKFIQHKRVVTAINL